MKNTLIAVLLAVLAWHLLFRGSPPDEFQALAKPASTQADFSCDGRTHCSQMTSCEEAEYFLQNCPGVKMDGNNDGEPCESQWCGNSR
jgi:hypothetical protein